MPGTEEGGVAGCLVLVPDVERDLRPAGDVERVAVQAEAGFLPGLEVVADDGDELVFHALDFAARGRVAERHERAAMCSPITIPSSMVMVRCAYLPENLAA